MRRVVCAAFLLAMFLVSTFAKAALVPSKFLDTVVAIGSTQPLLLPGLPCGVQWVTEGTGFLYGYLVKDDPDESKREYQVYLVTNRHVIEEHATTQSISILQQAQATQTGDKCNVTPTAEGMISVRLNPLNSSLQGRQFDVAIKEWFLHPNKNIDIAVLHLNAPFLKTEGLLESFFSSDILSERKDKLKASGVSAGDGIYVLGFPMNLAGVQRNYVIVRQGCIARISDMLEGYSFTYLVDAFVFPGSSGSPVILKPELVSIPGLLASPTLV